MQEDPPGPRKALGLPSAPDRGGPPGDVTLAPAPAGLAPPAPACFGGFVGPLLPWHAPPGQLCSLACAHSKAQAAPGSLRKANRIPSDSGKGLRSAPAVQATVCKLQGAGSSPSTAPQSQAGRQGSPLGMAFLRPPSHLYTPGKGAGAACAEARSICA